jgi:hypothetical protein
VRAGLGLAGLVTRRRRVRGARAGWCMRVPAVRGHHRSVRRARCIAGCFPHVTTRRGPTEQQRRQWGRRCVHEAILRHSITHPLANSSIADTAQLRGAVVLGWGHVQERVPLQSWAMLICILLVSTLNQWARQLFVYMSTVSTATAGVAPPGFFNLRIGLGLDVSQYGLLSGTGEMDTHLSISL